MADDQSEQRISIRSENDTYRDTVGRVFGLRIHDANMAGIHLSAGEELEIGLMRVDGSMTSLRFSGIQTISIAKMWENTIISEIFCWNVSDIATNTYARAALSDLYSDRLPKGDYVAHFEKIGSENGLLLFELVFAYGGHIVLTCKEMVYSGDA